MKIACLPALLWLTFLAVLITAGVSEEVGGATAGEKTESGLETGANEKVGNMEGAKASPEQQDSVKVLTSTSSETKAGFRRPKVLFLSLLCIATLVGILSSEISPLAKKPEGALKEGKSKSTKTSVSEQQGGTGKGEAVGKASFQTNMRGLLACRREHA